jgi:hypothetical protein
MVDSLELGGTGKTVALSFVVPAELFDAVTTIVPRRRFEQDNPQRENPQPEQPELEKPAQKRSGL